MSETQARTTFDTIEDETTGRWRDTEYRIVRTEDDYYTLGSGFNYEFVLVVDGEVITTAGELEQEEWDRPWIPALTRYAKAYIDGASDGV